LYGAYVHAGVTVPWFSVSGHKADDGGDGGRLDFRVATYDLIAWGTPIVRAVATAALAGHHTRATRAGGI
jgi:hypothetical protein